MIREPKTLQHQFCIVEISMGYTTRIQKRKRKYHFEIFILLMIPIVLLSFSLFLKYYKAPIDPELAEKSIFKVLVIRNDGSEQYKGLAFKSGTDIYTSSVEVFDFLNESAQNKDSQFYIENFQKELMPINKVLSMDTNSGFISFQTKSFRVTSKILPISNEFYSGDKIWAAGNRFTQIFDFRKGRILPLTAKLRKGHIQFKAAISKDNLGGPLLNEFGQVIGIVIKSDETSRTNEAVTYDHIQSQNKKKAFNPKKNENPFSKNFSEKKPIEYPAET
jgi:hypothetical protein